MLFTNYISYRVLNRVIALLSLGLSIFIPCAHAGYISRDDIAKAQSMMPFLDADDISNIVASTTPETCAALLILSDDQHRILDAIPKIAQKQPEFEGSVLLRLYYGFNQDDAITEQSDEEITKKLHELQNKLLPEYVCIDGTNVSFSSNLSRDFSILGEARKYASGRPADGGSALIGLIKLHAQSYIYGKKSIPLPTNIMTGLEALWAIVIYQGDSWTARKFTPPSNTKYVYEEKEHFNMHARRREGFIPYEIFESDKNKVCHTSFCWEDNQNDKDEWTGPFYGPTEREVSGYERDPTNWVQPFKTIFKYNSEQQATIIFHFKHAGKEYTLMTSNHIIHETS